MRINSAQIARLRSGRSMDSVDPYSSGWFNADNDFGYLTDPNFSTSYLPRIDINHSTLFFLYESNPLVRRYVNLWRGDATRKGFKLTSKSDSDYCAEIEKELQKRFNVLGILSKAIGVEKLHGGGLIYCDIDDGQDQKDPLNESGIRKIFSFQVIEKDYCIPYSYDDNTGTETPGEPLHYRIQLFSGIKAEVLIVHRSRVIRIPEMSADDNLSQQSKQKRFTWPVSPIQNAYDAIKRYGVGLQSMSQHLQNLVVDIFKVSDLDKISDKEKFRNYIKNQWKSKTSMKANVMGKEDDLTRIGTPLNDVGVILDAQEKDVSMSLAIPLSILYSNESGSLGGSTLSGDRLVWFDSIRSYQETKVEPVVQRMVDLLLFEKKREIQDMSIKFNELQELTEKEQMEVRKLAFESDQIIQAMGFPAELIFESRFSGDQVDLYSFNYDSAQVKEFLDQKMNFQEIEDEETKQEEDNDDTM